VTATLRALASNEILITDPNEHAWLLGWCRAGQWLAEGWAEK